MFDASDPRKALAKTPGVTGPFADAQGGAFDRGAPDEQGPGWRGWLLRAANLVLRHVEIDGEASFARSGQIDEYMAFSLDPGLRMTASAGGETAEASGPRLFILPPGDSALTLRGTGAVTFVHTARAVDLAARCPNAAAYAVRPRDVPPFQPWPDPPGGFRLRSYDLDVPEQEGRFGRIFRCTTMMVNLLPAFSGPRDTSRVSPHFHQSFEQISLTLRGDFVHHLRWPRTPDMAHWKDDAAIACASPSAVVLPPPAIHTSLWVSEDGGQIVDVFAPPRMDFSLREGWVLNADDYPLARTEIE